MWQMGRAFWVSYPCRWNLGCPITTEVAVIAGLLSWQILLPNLGFINFNIIMIYHSLFQMHETNTLWLFQETNHSVFLTAPQSCYSVKNSSHSLWCSQQHMTAFLGKMPFPQSFPLPLPHCSWLPLQNLTSVCIICFCSTLALFLPALLIAVITLWK